MTTVPDELVEKLYPAIKGNGPATASKLAARIAAEYYEPKIAELVEMLKVYLEEWETYDKLGYLSSKIHRQTDALVAKYAAKEQPK